MIICSAGVPSIATSNQVISWLTEMESLRKLLPEVSGLPLIVEIESEPISCS